MNEYKLKTELALPVYTVMSDTERLSAITNKVISVKQSIPTHDIKKYMMLANVWLPIKSGNTTATIKAMDALKEFTEFDMTDPLVVATLTGLLAGLVTDVPEFTETHKATVLSFSDKLISKVEELGLGNVTLGDVMRARV